MVCDISDYSVSVLDKMYARCVDSLESDERDVYGKTGSLIYLLQGLSSNRRSDIMRSTESMLINDETAAELLAKGCIRTGSTLKNYIPKARGLWVIESQGFSIDKLLDYLDLSIENADTKELTSDNKVVLATCIASRTFGPNAIVDLKRGEEIQDAWWDILVKISIFMKDVGVISKSFDEYISKSSIESGVSLKFRHTENIPRRTRGIFAKNGANGYYLDISDKNNNLDLEKLAYVIAAAFGSVLNSENIRQITRFVTRFYRENLTFISQETFTNEFDDREKADAVIEKAFEVALDNLELWKFRE